MRDFRPAVLAAVIGFHRLRGRNIDHRTFHLIDQWRKLEVETESASKELDDAGGKFAGLLQTLQENEDFIGELLEIRQAEKAIEVIRHLTRDIRDASTQLNKLIGGIKPPGV